MFCSKCGSQMSDDAAFCPKCGVPTPSPQPPPSDVSTTPPEDIPSVSESGGIAGGPKGEINKGKVILDIALNMIVPFLVGAIAVLTLGWLAISFINSFSSTVSLSIGDIPGFYSVVIRSGFFAAFLSIIPKAIVIKRRINDPNDTTYDIKSGQDEETNKKFEKKYHKFESVMEWILTIAVIIFAIYSLVVEFNDQYGDGIQEALNSTSSNSDVSTIPQTHGPVTQEEAQALLEEYFEANPLPGGAPYINYTDVEMYTDGEHEFYNFICLHSDESQSDVLLVDKQTGKLFVWDKYDDGIMSLDGWYGAMIRGEDPWLLDEQSDKLSLEKNEGNVSVTTYFVDSDPQGATIILEPDGTCAFLALYATGSAYYYGNYETTADGIVLHLTLDDGSVLNIPFENRGRSLAYTGAEAIRLTYPGAVYDRSEEVPDSVKYYPPYTEGTSSSAETVVLAQVTAEPTLRLREQPTAESYVSAEIPYREFVEIVYEWEPHVEWTMVQYAGIPGWVSTEYLEPYNAGVGSLTEQEARSLLEEKTASMPNAEGPAPMEYYGVIESSGRFFHAFWMSDVAGEGGEDLYAVNAESGGVHIIRLSDNAYMPFATYYGALFSMTDPWTGESLVW